MAGDQSQLEKFGAFLKKQIGEVLDEREAAAAAKAKENDKSGSDADAKAKTNESFLGSLFGN